MEMFQWMIAMLMIVFLYFMYLLQCDRETCRWEWGEVDNYYDWSLSLWVTCCGHKAIGKTTAEKYNFCPYCGREIVEVEDENIV